MSAHTPGPWFVMEQGFTTKPGPWRAPTVYATDDELRYIAVCACADFANGVNATDNLANARLIAAAPDLLDALEVLLIDRVLCAESATHGGPIMDAHNAIVKATGREPRALALVRGAQRREATPQSPATKGRGEKV